MSQIPPEKRAPPKKTFWLRKSWGWHPETKELWPSKKPLLKGQHPGQKQPEKCPTSHARVLLADLEAQAGRAGAWWDTHRVLTSDTIFSAPLPHAQMPESPNGEAAAQGCSSGFSGLESWCPWVPQDYNRKDSSWPTPPSGHYEKRRIHWSSWERSPSACPGALAWDVLSGSLAEGCHLCTSLATVSHYLPKIRLRAGLVSASPWLWWPAGLTLAVPQDCRHLHTLKAVPCLPFNQPESIQVLTETLPFGTLTGLDTASN